jgi:hypothetical protein
VPARLMEIVRDGRVPGAFGLARFFGLSMSARSANADSCGRAGLSVLAFRFGDVYPLRNFRWVRLPSSWGGKE